MQIWSPMTQSVVQRVWHKIKHISANNEAMLLKLGRVPVSCLFQFVAARGIKYVLEKTRYFALLSRKYAGIMAGNRDLVN